MVQNENGISSVWYAERSAMPVMMPGSAIGRISSSEIASRPKNFARASAAAASVPSTSASAVLQAATLKRQPDRGPDVVALPGHGEPLRGQRRRREDIALVLGAEGIQHDQRQRHVQEGDRPPRRPMFRPSSARSGFRAHRRPLAAWRTTVDADDDDRHQRERRGERHVAGHALLAVDDLADVERRSRR